MALFMHSRPSGLLNNQGIGEGHLGGLPGLMGDGRQFLRPWAEQWDRPDFIPVSLAGRYGRSGWVEGNG